MPKLRHLLHMEHKAALADGTSTKFVPERPWDQVFKRAVNDESRLGRDG